MLPSKRIKPSNLEFQTDHDYNVQRGEIINEIECVPEDETEQDILATSEEAFLARLSTTCSDNEDLFEAFANDGAIPNDGTITMMEHSSYTKERPEPTAMPSVDGLQNGSSMKESTAASLVHLFASLSKQIASMHNKADSIQEQIANISHRLGRVERKVGISLSTLETVKQVVITDESLETPQNQVHSSKRVNNWRPPEGQVKNVIKETNETLDDALWQEIQAVQKKMDNSLVTLNQLQSVIVVTDETMNNQPTLEIQNWSQPERHFLFKKITNEKNFTEFDSKLGKDKEYYFSLKMELVMRINAEETCKRLDEAMKMVFDPNFLALCSWSGHGVTEPEQKIAFKTRTNILKLFADVGSANCNTVSDLTIQDFFKRKLRNVYQRNDTQGIRYPICQ